MAEQDSNTPDAPQDEATDKPNTTPDAKADEGQDEGKGWDGDFDPDRARRTIEKLRAEKKDAAEKARKAAEEAEQAKKGAGESSGRIAELEKALLRERVGRRLGLPDALVDRLKGSTEDEIVADAEQLVDLVSSPKATARKPVEKLRPGGGDPDSEPEETDTRKLAERMFRR